MKELIPMNEHGIFADSAETARIDSRFIAKCFGKRHTHILRDITTLTQPKSGLSDTFVTLHFQPSSYKDHTGRTLPCYLMTRDGFLMLVMGYKDPFSMKLKEEYIHRFNEMDSFIRTLREARQTFPLLTDSISRIHEKPKPYHYSNECDMINRIVLGMSAKQYRLQHRIPDGESIRPHLTPEQIALIEELQITDVGLLETISDFHERKKILERRYHRSLDRLSTNIGRLPCRDINPQRNVQSFPG